MQQQTKLTKLRRVGLRLVCLLAAVFALSPSAGAWYVRGYFVKYGVTDNYSDIWSDGEDMGTDNSYTFGTVTSDKTIYFKLADNKSGGNKFYGGYDEYTFPDNGGNYGVKSDSNIDSVSQFLINMKPNKLYTISFNGSNLVLTVTDNTSSSEYCLKGINNDWDNGVKFEGSGNTLTAKVNWTNTSNSNGFKVVKGNKYYGTDNSNRLSITNNLEVSLNKENQDNTEMKLASSAEGKEVTFTLTLNNGTPSKLKATWNTGGSSTNVNILGSWPGSSIDATNGAPMTGKDGNSWYEYKIVPNADGTIQFRVKGGSTVYYPSGSSDVNITNKDEKKNTQTTNNNHWFKISCKANASYYVKYFPNDNNKVSVWWDDTPAVVTTTLPCVPERVTNRRDESQWATITSTNPVVYLLGKVINAERPSPEWEMISNDGGNTYTLDFTARDSKMTVWAGDNDNWKNYPYKVRVFTSKEDTGSDYGSISFGNGTSNSNNWDSMFTWKYQDGDLYPGRRYRATYTRSNNTLTFTALDDEKNYPPYMSLVGYYFKQTDSYTTPNEKQNDSGWQEAWLQFDKDGHIALDMNNKVMYNTMWPPKYPVYFYVQPQTDGEYIELSSVRLQMEPEMLENGGKKVLTGAQWKAQLQGDENYSNLFSSTFDGGEGQKQHLRDKDKYIRYVATNVWILGTAKIWTGWGGTYTENSSNQANWSNHANWGIGQRQSSYPPNDGTEISKGEPWNLIEQCGNFKFKRPTFFKTVEIFYCVQQDQKTDTGKDAYDAAYNGCIFYTTEGFGNPQINAKSTNNFRYGDYEISVSNVPTGCTVKSYTVTRFDATTGEPCTVRRENTGRANAVVISGDNLAMSESSFNNLATFATNVENSKEKTLADGKYYYELTVTFAKADGATATETVTSPIVTILNPDVNTRLLTSQLVELTEAGRKKLAEIEGEAANYQYITYSETLGTVYGVNYTGDEINPVSLNGSIMNYAPIYSDGAMGKFTDMVILSSPLSSKFSVNSNVYPMAGVGDYTVKGVMTGTDSEGRNTYADAVGTKVCGGKQSNGSYREIRKIDLKASDAADIFNVLLDYTYFPEDNSGVEGHSKPEQNTAYLTVPEPVLKKARIEVFYGSDNTSATDDDTKDFKFREFDLKGARYHNARELIEVEEPNVTADLATKMGANMGFTYKLGGETITLTNGKMVGKTKQPKTFYYEKIQGDDSHEAYNVKAVTIETSLKNIYHRWNGGAITGIKISDDAPNTFDHAVENNSLFYNEIDVKKEDGTIVKQDNLRASFDVRVRLNNNINNVISHKDKDNGDLTETLLHHSPNDYFYVAIYDNLTGEIAIDSEGNKAEFVATVSELSGSNGKVVKFHKDYGHWWDGQVAAVQKDPYYLHLEVRVSHLYPFSVEQSTDKPGMNRVAADHTGDVIKSQSKPWTSGEISTSVEGIEGVAESSVKAGVGFIEVAGNGVEIYSADGIKVAAGEGRHDLNAGVYMVRVSGRTQKVIVR